MNDKMQWAMALHDFFGSRGDDVAAVNPDDLRSVWTTMRDAQGRAPAGQQTGPDGRAFESVCGPGAHVVAVWYRASMLGLLQMIPEKPLVAWSHDGALDEAVFAVAAKFPMKKIPVGIVKNELPFDVSEFVKEIGREARESSTAQER